MLPRCAFTTLTLLVITISFRAQSKTPPASRKVAFVQSFYDWYLPIARDGHLKEAASTVAIKRRPEFFDKSLLRALQNDAAAQARAVGEIDGLDWDPFLTGNDTPPPHFKVITSDGGTVTVVGFDGDPGKPVVTLSVDVICEPTHCVITNFRYPASGSQRASDLKSALHLLHPSFR
jgi:hypothetical protein